VSDVKLTKNELRDQQQRLLQLEKYLPTLQLKKAMLQLEVHEMRQQIDHLAAVYQEKKVKVDSFKVLLAEGGHINPAEAAKPSKVLKRYENIAGVEVPYFEGVEFHDIDYNLFETPPWIDVAIIELRNLAEAHIRMEVVEEQKAALEKELREVSIRVNLFEKILIPRAISNIKKIKIFLGDQQLAAVSQAKVAKAKKENSHAD
jgi:V/A-type H+/Na+-transporting ATPase subunit D